MKNPKKVLIAPKPSQTPASLDDWVGGDNSGAAPQAVPVIQPTVSPVVEAGEIETVRLTIDLSKTLHTKFKLHCVAEGRKIAEVMRELIERELGLS